MSYDNMGRQTLLTPPLGQNAVSLYWDARSRRVLMMDNTGNVSVQYYPDGRVRAVEASAGLVTYVYDPAGRRAGMTYDAGSTQFGHNQDNNFTSVQNPFGETTGYSWDLAERLTTITLTNGSVVSIRYDDADRLVYKGDNAATGLGFSYYLDANGNRLTITENDGSVVNNAYDAKNRLTLETRTGTSAYSNGYSYDLNDNLTYARGNSYSVDIMGRITNAGFVYDANGRLTTRPGTDGTTYLSYDYAGRVTSLTLGSGLTISYGLDGDGRMLREKRAGKNVYYLLDGKNVLKEWGTQVVTVTNTAGTPAVPIALRPRDLDRPAMATKGGVTVSISQEIIDYTHGLGLLSQRTTLSRFYRFDGIGTLRNLEDSSRNVVTSSVFDAYGLQQNSVTLASAYGFIGEEGVRGEKGQAPGTIVPQNMRARMYDPLTGRFTSRDPIWDKNLYAYGNGNPWTFTDPDGMQASSRDMLSTIDSISKIDPHGSWQTILRMEHFDELAASGRPEIVGVIRDDIQRVYRSGANVPRYPYSSVLPQLSREAVQFWLDILSLEVKHLSEQRDRDRAASLRSRIAAANPVDPSLIKKIPAERHRVEVEQSRPLRQELEDLSYLPLIGSAASGFAAPLAAFDGDRMGAAADAVGAVPGELWLRTGSEFAKFVGPLGRRVLPTVAGKLVLFFRGGAQVIVNHAALKRAVADGERLEAKRRTWAPFSVIHQLTTSKLLPGSRGLKLKQNISIDQMIALTQMNNVEFALMFFPNVEVGREGRYVLYSGTSGSVNMVGAHDGILLYHTHPVTATDIERRTKILLASDADRLTMSIRPSPQKKSVIINVDMTTRSPEAVLNVFDSAHESRWQHTRIVPRPPRL